MVDNNIINLTNNNNILIDISFKLEDIIDVLNDSNINNKMKEIVNLMNKVIKDDNDEIKEIINKNNNAL